MSQPPAPRSADANALKKAVQDFLDSHGRVFGVASLVLIALSIVLAGWGRWDGAGDWLAGAISRQAVAGGLAVLAVLSFALWRTKSSILPALPWAGAVLGYIVAGWLVIGEPELAGSQDRVQAIVFGLVSVGFLAVVAILFEGFDAGAALSTKTSMASTVLMLWSGVVVYAIAFVAALALTDGGSLTCTDTQRTDCIVESAWEDYVVLLGAPGAAAAIAKSRKVAESADLSNDAQATNQVAEVQYFVFNLIAMAVVIGGLWRYGRLGEVPDLLLGLSGAAALTYALVKRLPSGESAPGGLSQQGSS